MLTTNRSTSAQLRRLAAELRGLRATSGLPREAIAAKTNLNVTSIYRIETARVRPQQRSLITLLDLYGVEGADREWLVELSRDAGHPNGLQPDETDLPLTYRNYLDLEYEATRLQLYESLYIPSLLQTDAYTREIIQSTTPSIPDELVAHRIEARRRRTPLKHPARTLWAIVDEAALRRRVGGYTVMNAQLENLLHLAGTQAVTLQVLPYGIGAHPGMPGAFVVMEFPHGAPALVYTEATSGSLMQEDPPGVERHRSIFRRLAALALSPTETVTFIKSAIAAGHRHH